MLNSSSTAENCAKAIRRDLLAQCIATEKVFGISQPFATRPEDVQVHVVAIRGIFTTRHTTAHRYP